MKFKCCINAVTACVVIFALVLSFSILNFNYPKHNIFSVDIAYADPVIDTPATLTLDAAQSKLDLVQAEYDSIMNSVNDLSAQIADVEDKAFAVQENVFQKQEEIRSLAKYEYRNSMTFSLTSLLIESENFQDLLKNLDYANSIMDYQYTISVEHKQKKAELDQTIAELNEKSSSEQELLDQAEKKLNEAQEVVTKASASLKEDQLSALKTRAANMAVDTSPSTPIGPGLSPVRDSDPVPSPTPAPAPTPQPVPSSWATGIASAYGGSSDPYTPNPGITCIGEVCNDWSMGVAVPMAWPNYRSYLRHTVQIRYNGMTCLARINDCGYMGGGSRSLDLQPGVFKFFGFQTCNAWGLRTVEYNIL